MRRYGTGVSVARVGVLLAVAGVGCAEPVPATRADPLYCDERTPCQQQRAMCDLARHECVATAVDLVMSRDMARPECLASADCAAERPICERQHCRGCVENTDDDACRQRGAMTPRCGPGGRCVACRPETQDSDCAATAPICRDGACRPCAAHGECGTGACAADGSCELPHRVYWVDNGGRTSVDCRAAGVHDGLSRATAFCDVSSALAAPAPRPIIVIRGGGQDAFAIRAGTVKIIGPGAFDVFLPGEVTLRATTRGTPAITIGPESPAQVTIEDLRFQGGSGAAALWCQSPFAPATLVLRNSYVQGGLGDDALSLGYSCTATIEDSHVRQSRNGIWCYGCNAAILRSTIARNTRGVLLEDGQFFGQTIIGSLSLDACTVERNSDTGIACQSSGHCVITNSLIAANGTLQTGLGGVVLAGTVHATLDFDTIVGNQSPGAPAGVYCLSPRPNTIANSIVWGNARASGSQLDPRCVLSQVVTGAGDTMGLARDPAFVGPEDFHLRAGDPANRGAGGCCVDRARPAAATTWADHDRDRGPRPRGAGHDIGAYEGE